MITLNEKIINDEKMQKKVDNLFLGVISAAYLTLFTVAGMSYIHENYKGSFSKFYQSQMEKLNKAPLNFH